MARRTLVLASVLSLGVPIVWAFAACTTTATTIVDDGLCQTQATLTIASPPGYDGGAPTCVAVPDPMIDVVPVAVDVMGSFALRPPGTPCASMCNCGYLALYVDNDGTPNNISGSAVIDVDFSNQPLDAHPGGGPYGVHTLTVALVWDLNDGGGEDIFDGGVASGNGVGGTVPSTPYTASVTVDIEPSCPDGGTVADAGSDAGDGGDGG